MEKITEIATTLINGNISDFKRECKYLTILEFINLVYEYCLLTGETERQTLNYFHKFL